MQKRFITLDAAERSTLQAGRHHHPHYQFRARCQCLLLSADGQGVVALMAVLGVSRTTVFAWFERWEKGGLAGLANAPGQGRPSVLTAADEQPVRQAVEQPVRQAVEQHRQQLKEVTATLGQELNKAFSPKTLKRFLKSLAGRGDGFGIA